MTRRVVDGVASAGRVLNRAPTRRSRIVELHGQLLTSLNGFLGTEAGRHLVKRFRAAYPEANLYGDQDAGPRVVADETQEEVTRKMNPPLQRAQPTVDFPQAEYLLLGWPDAGAEVRKFDRHQLLTT